MQTVNDEMELKMQGRGFEPLYSCETGFLIEELIDLESGTFDQALPQKRMFASLVTPASSKFKEGIKLKISDYSNPRSFW